MVNLPHAIELMAVADGSGVAADFVTLNRALAQEQIDAKWWQLPGVSKGEREQENDYEWRWAKRLGELKNDRWHEAVAIQTEDLDIQGAILYWFNTRSFVDEDMGAVYVEALATAPRNRPWLVKAPLYRGVGDALLLRTVAQSYELGLEGRVNLEAFDDSRLLEFYQARGFSLVGYEDELPRLELSPIEARSWLQDEGYEL